MLYILLDLRYKISTMKWIVLEILCCKMPDPIIGSCTFKTSKLIERFLSLSLSLKRVKYYFGY